MKKVAIVQSNYIPWKGYFDLISSVDEFIIFDSAQYTRRDWRNRNQIKTARGTQWITIPVKTKGNFYQQIKNVEVSESGWAEAHWKNIYHAYGRAPYFQKFSEEIKNLYDLTAKEKSLSCINILFLKEICKFLNITTPFKTYEEIDNFENKNERLIALCKQAKATHYVSGPAAKEYLCEQAFQKEGIEVRWKDYSNYPTYKQLHGEFVDKICILDLIFNCGSSSEDFVWKHRK